MRNTPAFVTDRPSIFLKSIDGIIGWPELSILAFELDAANKTVTLFKSYEEEAGVDNFFWIGDPHVYLLGGSPLKQLIFFMDTGSGDSWFSEMGIKQIQPEILNTSKHRNLGINGSQKQKARILNVSGLFLDGKEIQFREYKSIDRNFMFLRCHGFIGADVAQAGKLRLNFPQSRVVFEPFQ